MPEEKLGSSSIGSAQTKIINAFDELVYHMHYFGRKRVLEEHYNQVAKTRVRI